MLFTALLNLLLFICHLAISPSSPLISVKIWAVRGEIIGPTSEIGCAPFIGSWRNSKPLKSIAAKKREIFVSLRRLKSLIWSCFNVRSPKVTEVIRSSGRFFTNTGVVFFFYFYWIAIF